MLVDFGIVPCVKQVAGDQGRHLVRDFEAACARYLGSTEPPRSAEGVDDVLLQEEPSMGDVFKSRRRVEEEKKLMD